MHTKFFHTLCALILGLQATASGADVSAVKSGNALRFQGKNYEFKSFEDVRSRSFTVAGGVPFISKFTDIGVAGYRFSAIVTLIESKDQEVQECASLPGYANKKLNYKGLISLSNLGVFTVQTAPCGVISSRTTVARKDRCLKNMFSIGCTAIIAGSVVRSKRNSWVFAPEQNIVEIDYIEYTNQTNIFELAGKMALDNIDLIGIVRSGH